MDRFILIKFLEHASRIMNEKKDYLIDLDSIVGDGDLGLTMSDGFAAAYRYAQTTDETDIGKFLYGVGKTMSTAVPSTMGTLMASGFMHAGKILKGKTELSNLDFITLFEAYFAGVQNRGKANLGEKTFLDGLYPAIVAMKNNETNSLLVMATAAKKASEAGFKYTTTMVALHGRAATRGEASRSLEDPGAAVAFLMMCAFVDAMKEML